MESASTAEFMVADFIEGVAEVIQSAGSVLTFSCPSVMM